MSEKEVPLFCLLVCLRQGVMAGVRNMITLKRQLADTGPLAKCIIRRRDSREFSRYLISRESASLVLSRTLRTLK